MAKLMTGGPATDGAAVVQSDTTVLTNPGVLYVAATGDVKVRTIGGTDLTFKSVPAGMILPVMVDMVYDTGTTVTDANLLLLYGGF